MGAAFKRPFYIRSAEWYSVYRFGVFAAIRDAKNKKAESIALIGVRPAMEAKRTCMEFPAIMEDLLFSCKGKYAPFHEHGKENISWSSLCELRVEIGMLESVLLTLSKSGFTPLVISCSEHDQKKAKAIISKHNEMAKKDQLAQAGTCWATAKDCFSQTLENDPTPPKTVMWRMLVLIVILLTLWVMTITWMVSLKYSQIALTKSRAQEDNAEACLSKSEAANVHKHEMFEGLMHELKQSLKIEESQRQQITAEAEQIAVKEAFQRLEESHQIIAERTLQLHQCKATAIRLEDLQSNFTSGNDFMERFAACSESICQQSKSWTGCHAVLRHLQLCPSDHDLSQPTPCQGWTPHLRLCQETVSVIMLVFVGAILICLALILIWMILVKCSAVTLGSVWNG